MLTAVICNIMDVTQNPSIGELIKHSWDEKQCSHYKSNLERHPKYITEEETRQHNM